MPIVTIWSIFQSQVTVDETHSLNTLSKDTIHTYRYTDLHTYVHTSTGTMDLSKVSLYQYSLLLYKLLKLCSVATTADTDMHIAIHHDYIHVTISNGKII